MERVRVAVVGVAGQGGWNLNEVVRTELATIVALCDVDQSRAAPVRQKFPQARFYDDYRRLVEQKDIQAVLRKVVFRRELQHFLIFADGIITLAQLFQGDGKIQTCADEVWLEP